MNELKKNVTLFLTFIIVMFALLTASSVIKENNTKIVVIDAGHGGFDGGAERDKYIEKDITLNASLILGEMLEKTGYKVTYTRKNNFALDRYKVKDMQKRLKIINRESTMIFISLHANIYHSPVVRGAQVFYNSNNKNSKILSEYIQEMFTVEDKLNKKNAKGITGKYILDEATSTGCIVEMGFMSNPDDLKILTSDALLEKRCLMIYLGILKYLEINS